MKWYLTALKRYAIFSGRAGRSEFWMFVLFNIIFTIAAGIMDSMMGTWGAIGGIYALVLLIPSIAVGVRRLHDIGKSGWMILISLIPIIGAIWLIVLWATEGQAAENQYGQQTIE
jgi:uncharacterized membrane protein YhaH (DUF805 family)